MKWIIVSVLSFLVFSCKKEKGSNSGLVGKWKTIEIYQGNVMGGCLCWEPVEDQNAAILEFHVTGRYKWTQPVHFSVPSCSGNYRIKNDSTIAMSYECHPDPSLEIERRFSREGDILIIDYQGFEGAVRYKFRRF